MLRRGLPLGLNWGQLGTSPLLLCCHKLRGLDTYGRLDGHLEGTVSTIHGVRRITWVQIQLDLAWIILRQLAKPIFLQGYRTLPIVRLGYVILGGVIISYLMILQDLLDALGDILCVICGHS